MSVPHERDDGVYLFENYCKNVLNVVRALADATGQREAWIEGKIEQKHIWCDIFELLASFDDLNPDGFLQAATTRLHPDIVERLRAVHTAIDAIAEWECENSLILFGSKSWRKVQAAAQSVLEVWDPPSWPW